MAISKSLTADTDAESAKVLITKFPAIAASRNGMWITKKFVSRPDSDIPKSTKI